MLPNSCLILGGGINGLLSALRLKQAGLEVRLLDQGALGQESSWAGAGILSSLLPWNYGEEVNAMARRGRVLWPDLARQLRLASGIDPEYLCCGMAVLSLEQRDAALAWCESHGEAVSDLPKRLSTAHRDPREGLWLPSVAQARNPRILRALCEAAVRAGVRIEEHAQVTRLVTQGGKVVTVETTHGQFSAASIVVAAGAWSGSLLASLGHAPEITPIRGQIVLFKTDPELLTCVVYRRGHYLVPRADGHILAGSTLESVGFDKTTTMAAREELLDFAYELLPALRRTEVVTQWAGLRPGSPGNVPTIDRHPELDNLYVNSGHFRYGVTMAPAAAEVLLHRMLGQVSVIDAAPYAWVR